MTRTVYVNGAYVPEGEASVSIFDRGFLFADGVYDVNGVLDGKLVDYAAHIERFKRSCRELNIEFPMGDDDLLALHRELISRNNLREGMVYLQVTRGNPDDRDFTCDEEVKPTFIAFTKEVNISNPPKASVGIKAVTVPDIRWARRDIKSIALLPQVLARFEAKRHNVDVALMVQDGYITEEAASSAHIVKDGVLITRPLSNDILDGITRKAMLALLDQGGIALDERLYTVDEMLAADEVFVTSATGFLIGVVEIDGKMIGDGTVGPVAKKLREIYIAFAKETAV